MSRDEWYERYHQAVNMSADQLAAWADDPCSKLASESRAPIRRNLHLLRTRKARWGDKEVRWAKRTVSFIARMRAVSPGKPAAPGCPSKRDIALKNWGYDPEKGVYHRNDRLPGGLADKRRVQDFDPEALRKGTLIELEHTGDLAIAQEIAMDHLVEHADYYDALEQMEASLEKKRTYRPNRRVRVYDAEAEARKMRETFADRPVEKREHLPFSWPAQMQNVGDSLAVAYASDKWKPTDRRGRREVELYKHLAESRNYALAAPGVIYDYEDPSTPWDVRGPMVSLADMPMPRHFAILGLFEEIVLDLYTSGRGQNCGFDGGEEVVHVQIKHAYLGGSVVKWSEEGGEDQPFIFVYTKDDGVMFVVFGDELDIEKDGIVG